MVRLRLSISRESIRDRKMTNILLNCNSWSGTIWFTNADEPLEVVVGKLLLERNQTTATAESCSGDIAHLITSIPGSSAYYEGSLVTYSQKPKKPCWGG